MSYSSFGLSWRWWYTEGLVVADDWELSSFDISDERDGRACPWAGSITSTLGWRAGGVGDIVDLDNAQEKERKTCVQATQEAYKSLGGKEKTGAYINPLYMM